jgi:glycosyltransferase involved in cell wall biosynthesis
MKNLSPRVLHLTPAIFGEGGVYGGAERYSLELARAMARRVSTTLLSFGEESSVRTTDEGLRIRVLGKPWRVRGQRFNPWHSGIVPEVLRASVVHCHQPCTLAAETAAIVGRATGRRVFASDLGGGGWGLSSRMDTSRLFHGHLHLSDYSREIAGHAGRRGAEVIVGGVDVERFRPDPVIAKEPLVVFVGRLMAHKGVELAIEALPPGMRMEVIGRPYQAEYANDLRRLAEGKAVTFREDANDDEIIQAYRRASAVVLLSVHLDRYGNRTEVPELLGQTLLEGMACGTPAIGTNVASLPELLEDGVSGFVVPANSPETLRERLLRLRDEAGLVQRMGFAARARVLERFQWTAVVDRCLSAYGIIT